MAIGKVNMKTQGFIVWAAGIVVVLGIFFCFVALGWPGTPNGCTETSPDTCYCEAFDIADVQSGAPGVRQRANTWFNLYSIVTSLLIAFCVWCDRKNGSTVNPMRSHCWIPDLYIFAVLFLGLGSMWFHASLTEWGGIIDEMSMFVYASFLVFYSVYRLWPNGWFFGVGYGVNVLVFTIIGALWKWEWKSLTLIIILVVAYLALEVAINIRDCKFMQGKALTIVLWSLAVVAIGLATMFWALSQTGGPMCDPNSIWQPHGLLWHPLAGVMAVLLYFFWRAENA